MKRVLSFLLCIVFLKAQVVAHSGGPNEESETNIDVSGTYSGTLIPRSSDAGTETADGSSTLNSLGLFTIGMPTSGPGSGTFLIFTQGLTFSGIIAAVGDPGRATINAILEATYDFTDFVYDANGNILVDGDGEPISQDYSLPVRGTMNAKVTLTSFTNQSALASANLGRITGTAQLAIIIGQTAQSVLVYAVDGTKQDFFDTGGGNLSAAGAP